MGCLSEQAQVQDLGNSDSSITDDSNNNNITPPTLDQSTNFIQIGTQKITTTLSLATDFKDSFLIRGNNVIDSLIERTKTNQQNYCLVSFFPETSGASKNILIMSARIRSLPNITSKTKEYFLQVEPNNETINRNDCLTLTLTNQLSSIYASSAFAFKASNVCPSCSAPLTSSGLRLYEKTGKEDSRIKISFLFISLNPKQNSNNQGSSNNQGITCSTDLNCTALNFDCCLNNQCVNHAQVKSNVDTNSTEFLIANQIIQGDPVKINDYEHLFYLCPNKVVDPTPPGDTPDDPTQEANDLLTELQKLYDCVTPIQDEFAICTKDYNNASQLMSAAAFSFDAETDDINFSNITSTENLNNIVAIEYAGQSLYKEKILDSDVEVSLDSAVTLSNPNDELSSSQSASFQKPKPTNAPNDIVSISYRVDGTCEKLGSFLAKCKKFYTQGQDSNPPRSSDHPPTSNTFSLPSYIDTSLAVIVRVNGSIIPEGPNTWTLQGRSVTFNPTEFPIFPGQKVELEYFVTSKVSDLTKSKSKAQDAINAHCQCDPQAGTCRIEPVEQNINGQLKVTSFKCVYPEANQQPIPLQQTVFVSSKSVPQKFFDEFGVNVDLGDESSNNKQEGESFEYLEGNKLKPNNVSKYVGFNEIYGSMNVDGSSPLPPKVVNLEKGKTYDIFVDDGAFSSCLDCGADYYSGLQKIFPNNFSDAGAGYRPALVESRKRTNRSSIPADDFRFGRACFVPATMIPWTHVAEEDVTTQRRNRLANQHFLFANGYNKDWYGFDYGAMIGSFDGVKWFAIGTQRKIRAEGSKLYLAINAYLGDLTINNTMKVVINETVPVPESGSLILTNIDNDGAQCQRSHFCEVDEDCITQLGYDYVCQNVSALETPWPLFDENGNEVTGNLNRKLLSLSGGANGQAKRCVYRGRGAICEQRSLSISSEDSYTNSSLAKLHTCSPNSTCENLNQNKFNNKISRFAQTPANQNIQSFITEKSDTFGLAARIPTRPYDYYGNETPLVNVRLKLNENNVNSICIPGKDINSITTIQDLNLVSVNEREADKISNVGRTISSIFLQDENYFAACPATDDDGNFTHFQDLPLTSELHNPQAVRNNLSTNSLILNSLENKNIFNDNKSIVDSIGHHKNTCLRAPGASCFSDFECAPSSFIASRFKSVSNFNGEISNAEEKFWEEELICGNSQNRLQINNIDENPFYDNTTHKCCRELNKDFTYKTQTHENSEIETIDFSNNRELLIPGLNQDINNPKRYSRNHVVYDKVKSNRVKYPPLLSASPRPSSPLTLSLGELRQYNTLHVHNERMCCTGHWVRKFASGANAVNGGTVFSGNTQQTIPVETFKPLAFTENNIPAQNPFPDGANYDPLIFPYTCTGIDVDTTDCEVRNNTPNSSFERKYLNWFSKLELIGIPQVLIETNLDVEKPLSTDEQIDLNGDGDFDDPGDISNPQRDISSLRLPLDDTIKDINNGGIADVLLTEGNQPLYSAASYDNFEIGAGKLKKIFSEDEFKCCIPTGFAPDNNLLERSCCSGTARSLPNDQGNVCCLADFTNVSVYTNRYVSSEGAFFSGQEISDDDIDPKTGYIRKEIVEQMAKNMCCSGEAATGKVISDYIIPRDFDEASFDSNGRCRKTRRFLFQEVLDNFIQVNGGINDYEDGLKWNNQIYCVPAGFNNRDIPDCTSNGGTSGSGASGT